MSKYEHEERDIHAPLQNRKMSPNCGKKIWTAVGTREHRRKKREIPVPISSESICSTSFPKLTLISSEAYKSNKVNTQIRISNSAQRKRVETQATYHITTVRDRKDLRFKQLVWQSSQSKECSLSYLPDFTMQKWINRNDRSKANI